MDGSGLAFLEASLVDLGLYQVRVMSLDPFKDRFLHDLLEVGSHDDGSDLIKIARSFCVGFL